MLKKYSWLIVPLLIAGFFLGQYLYKMPKYTNGREAPTFSAELRNGSPFKLTDLRGQYVLLDFWGSWCGPCRAQNPDLVRLYEQYRDTQFEDGEGLVVLNVGVEQKRERWEQAIAQDKLNWPYHIFDQATSLRFFDSPIADAYGITEVPSSYLIDPAGNIIGVNMEPNQVARLLAQRLPN